MRQERPEKPAEKAVAVVANQQPRQEHPEAEASANTQQATASAAVTPRASLGPSVVESSVESALEVEPVVVVNLVAIVVEMVVVVVTWQPVA